VARKAQREAALAKAREGRIRSTREAAEGVIEDVEFMLTHRESMHMASRRLGMKPETLQRYLEKHHRSDLASALKRNQYEYTSSPKKEW
jgi:hypothetical protein